jgi:5'-3' exonuclease
MPKEFEEIWVEVFNYINNIVNILKPNKMIFLALDGVAPRSKMNNQRSRRFKSARDYK